jgi:hypothetical protein
MPGKLSSHDVHIPVRLITTDNSQRRSMMSALAVLTLTMAPRPDPRGCDLPTCPVCADSMIAAEASVYIADNEISYLWTCDTCGYGFVTKHPVNKRFACN